MILQQQINEPLLVGTFVLRANREHFPLPNPRIHKQKSPLPDSLEYDLLKYFQEEVTLTWMECWLYLKPCRSDSRAASSTDENTSDEETSDNCCVLVLENKDNENSSRVQNQTIRLSSSSLPLVSYFFINYLALAPTTWVLL